MKPRDGISSLGAALGGRCPRCGRGRLYAGLLKLTSKCSVCGLDIARYDPGDGPAAFAIFAVGFIVTGSALWLELARQPPYWVHALLWPPLIALLTPLLLRLLKSWLVASQFRHDAREGRRSEDDGRP